MLLLASKSPRRKEILTAAGIPFEVRPCDVPEVRDPEEGPVEYVCRLAVAKARAIHPGPGDVVLGADTVVVLDDHVLEKPADAADARRMLGLLSGREHQVVTGFCLRSGAREIVDAATTGVRFIALTAAEIDDYVASGEPVDKAGAYAIQGLASKFITSVAGCYFNVVGLPVASVYNRLKEF